MLLAIAAPSCFLLLCVARPYTSKLAVFQVSPSIFPMQKSRIRPHLSSLISKATAPALLFCSGLWLRLVVRVWASSISGPPPYSSRYCLSLAPFFYFASPALQADHFPFSKYSVSGSFHAHPGVYAGLNLQGLECPANSPLSDKFFRPENGRALPGLDFQFSIRLVDITGTRRARRKGAAIRY